MSSTRPPIILTVRDPAAPNNTSTDLQFSLGTTEAIVQFAKFGKAAASGIREANKALQTIVNSIKSVLAIISTASNLFQGIIAIGKTIVEDALAIGGHAIIVHPWNQRNKAYKSLIYNGIEKKKQEQAATPENQQFFSRVNNWIDDVTSTVSASTTQPEVMNLGIPQLTVQGAINEVLWACDNIKDPLRPKFTSRMYTCGIGFILSVTNPLDLTGMIDALKAIFDFSEFDLIETKLKKRYEQFEKQMKNRGTDFLSALLEKNTAEYQKEWEALGIKTQLKAMSVSAASAEIDKATKSQGTYQANIQPQMVVEKYDFKLVSDMIGKALLTGDSGPRWFGFRLDMIPLLKDIKETIDAVIDGGSYFVSFVNDSIVEVITIIMRKIEFIMKNLEAIASMLDSIDKLRASFLAGGAYLFLIEPEVGGMDHLKSDLQKLASLIPNSGVAGYSVLISLIAGFPNYGDGNAYVKALAALFDKDKNPIDTAYGLKIFIEPNPSSSYAMTDYSSMISLEVRTLTDLDFKYQYHFRSYPKDSPLDVVDYSSTIRNSSERILLKAIPDMIYELEVRGDTVVKTQNSERDFDIIFHRFRIIQKLDLTVSSESASVENVSGTYYLHIPVVVRIYNFSTATVIRYSTSTTSTTDITDYVILTDEEDVDYSDISFDAVYTITFTNTRPDAITDTVYASQNKLLAKSEFTISSKTLTSLIAAADEDITPTTVPNIKPTTPEKIISPAVFPPDPRTTDSFCVTALVSKYLDRNKRCEIVVPLGVKTTIMFYDCQDSISSIKFYMTYNSGKYDCLLTDKGTSRIPNEPTEYFYATATTTTPAMFELNNFITGYYVIRLSIYWKPGSFRYQKAGGVLPQEFDIYLKVVEGATSCFEVE